MVFINSPFEILNKAFENLYPEKAYRACIEPEMKDEEGNTVYGYTQFNDGEIPVVAISADLTIRDSIEIFAHELAHVAAGKGEGHGEKWEKEFEKIFQEYHRIGAEMFISENEENAEERRSE